LVSSYHLAPPLFVAPSVRPLQFTVAACAGSLWRGSNLLTRLHSRSRSNPAPARAKAEMTALKSGRSPVPLRPCASPHPVRSRGWTTTGEPDVGRTARRARGGRHDSGVSQSSSISLSPVTMSMRDETCCRPQARTCRRRPRSPKAGASFLRCAVWFGGRQHGLLQVRGFPHRGHLYRPAGRACRGRNPCRPGCRVAQPHQGSRFFRASALTGAGIVRQEVPGNGRGCLGGPLDRLVRSETRFGGNNSTPTNDNCQGTSNHYAV